MVKGVDLIPKGPVKVRIGGKEYPLSYAGGLPWALLEERYGGPLLTNTVPTVFAKLVEGGVADVLYIAWCGLQHLKEEAPTIEEVQRANVFDFLVGEQGVGDGPLTQALLAALPKQMAAAPANAQTAAKTGTGNWLSTLRRRFFGGRPKTSGTA